MKRRLYVYIVILSVLLTGCIRQRPVLASESTPAPTPTPTPPPVVQSIIQQTDQSDAAGETIWTEDHYIRYLTFTNLRVYEYEGGTLFDGVCRNDYPETLNGAFDIVFTDKDGTVIARAPVYTRTGEDGFVPGETIIYAEINTDMDIRLIPFSLTVTKSILPQTKTPAVSRENNNSTGG